jgi:hypothetical protein
MPTRKIAVIEGLGFKWLDSSSGQVYLIERLKVVGIDCGSSPFHYADSQGVYDFLKTADWRGIVGDSFGACFGPEYAGSLAPTKVDYVAGFQPSVYSSNIQTAADGTKFIPVPANVVTAHCIRDPNWIDTGGLGYATWIADNPKATRLLITDHPGAHPDDTGYTQDLVFAEIKSLVGA